MCSVEYVVSLEYVPDNITIIPHAPAHKSKICSSFGRTIILIDLAILFHFRLESFQQNTTNKLLIILNQFTDNSQQLGLLVDEIYSVTLPNEIHKANDTLISHSLIKNFYASKNTQDIVMELDIPKILFC